MDVLYTDIMVWIQKLLLPLFRVGGMVMVAPVFSVRMVPLRYKMLVAIMISLPICAALPDIKPIDIFTVHGFLLVAQQLLIGIMFGFVFQVVFQVFIVGAQLVGMQSGLGFASMVDPQSGFSVPLLSQLYLMLTTLLFLAINGHLQLIVVINDSFKVFPLDVLGFPVVNFYEMVMWGKQIFIGAVMIALPAIVALLLVNISFGMLTRTAPQLNIFTIGFPIGLTMGIFMVYVILSNSGAQLEDMTRIGFDLVDHWLARGTS